MKSIQQSREIVIAAASLLRAYDEATADGTGISIPEAVGILATNAAALITAARGAGEVPAEAADYTPAELDDLNEAFLTTMGWEPTAHNRQVAGAYYRLIRGTYTSIAEIIAGHRPPVAA